MSRCFHRTFLGGFLVVLFIGCTAPLLEITDNPIKAGDEQSVSMDQVREAIMQAGEGLGWKMQATQPGEIIGTYQWKRHSAIVKIPYSTQHYSIFYKSSQNLRYNGAKIHKRYNILVENLSTAIGRELTKATGQEQPPPEEPTTMGSLKDWLRDTESEDEESEGGAPSPSK